jgi:hypothetical protein
MDITVGTQILTPGRKEERVCMDEAAVLDKEPRYPDLGSSVTPSPVAVQGDVAPGRPPPSILDLSIDKIILTG